MLTAKLILERLDRDGRLLERREQLSKSFTKGFLELLYLAHAQITAGAPYNMTDIYGNARTVDSQAISAARQFKENLRIGAPAGIAHVFCLVGNELDSASEFLKGEMEASKIGIQVGRGDTAVTPTDTKLENRIYHGRQGIDGAPVLYTCYNTGDDEDGHHGIYPDFQEGQSFQVAVPLHLTSVKLKVFRTGTPGDITVAIQKADADGKPDGVDLVTKDVNCDAIAAASPGEWVTWTFAASIALEPWPTT
ncbi:unnamed protein product, partial [marine sediment metagenome]